MPLLLNTPIKFFTFCSLVISGVSFANSGFVFGMPDFVFIIFFLFSGFGEMPGAQARFQISPIRQVDQPIEIDLYSPAVSSPTTC